MGIDNAGGRAACQQKADSCCIRSVKCSKICACLSDQSRQAGPSGRVTHSEERQHAAIVAVEGDQAAGGERDAFPKSAGVVNRMAPTYIENQKWDQDGHAFKIAAPAEP